MKKLIALLTVVAVMMTSVVSFADSSRSDAVKTVEEYCVNVLNGLCDYYDKRGDAIDDDYIELTYKYFQFWMTASCVYRKELQFNIKSLIGSKTFGADVTSENGWTTIMQEMQNEWLDYVNGKKDKKTYAKMLFSVVKAMISTSE